MSNHYVEFEVRDGSSSATCTNLTDARAIYEEWIKDADGQEVILVRIDTDERVLKSSEDYQGPYDSRELGGKA